MGFFSLMIMITGIFKAYTPAGTFLLNLNLYIKIFNWMTTFFHRFHAGYVNEHLSNLP